MNMRKTCQWLLTGLTVGMMLSGSINLTYANSVDDNTDGASAVTSLEVTLPSLEPGDSLTMNGQTVTLTFEDGTTAEGTFKDDSASCDDYYMEYYLTDSEGYRNFEEAIIYETGNYILTVQLYNTEYEHIEDYEFPLTIEALTTDHITEEPGAMILSLGESYDFNSSGTTQWYIYTCSESGKYQFQASAITGQTYFLLYESTEDGSLSYVTDSFSGYAEPLVFRSLMESGKTYYFKLGHLSDESAESEYVSDDFTESFQVSLTKPKNITRIQVNNLAFDSFIQYESHLCEDGTVLTLTYEDGTSDAITYYDGTSESTVYREGSYKIYDSYMNCISYYMENGDEAVDPDYLITQNTGTYSIYFYYYDSTDETSILSNPLSVTVSSPVVTTIELLNASYTSESSGDGSYLWYAYTPSTDGIYYFVSTIETTSNDYEAYPSDGLMYFDEEGFQCSKYPEFDDLTNDYAYDSAEGKYYIYSLTAGKTYYFIYHYTDNETPAASAIVSVTAMQENHAHSYNNAIISWTWVDDYSAATATLRCDTCSDTIELKAEVTSEITSSAGEDDTIVYTATVIYNGMTFTDAQTTALISAEGDSPADNPSADSSESTHLNSSSDDVETAATAPKTGDSNLLLLLLFATIGCILSIYSATNSFNPKR